MTSSPDISPAPRGWVNGPYGHTTEAELNSLPVGTVRSFDLGGVLVAAEKLPGSTWVIRSRKGVPSRVLAKCTSAERFWVIPEVPASKPVQRADHISAMHRMAKASAL